MPSRKRLRLLYFSPRVLGAAIATAIALLAPQASLAATSVVLRWTAPGDDGNVGQASTYELRYSESSVTADTTSWWSDASSAGTLPPPRTAGSQESFTVAGLDSGKTYYFIIRARDEVPNWSGNSNVAVKSTSDGGGSLPTPESFVALPAPGGVRLSWDAVTTGGATGYHIYRGASGVAIGTLIHTAPITETSWIDSTAQAGQTHKYSLTSFSGAMDSDPAEYTISVPSDGIVESTGGLRGYPNPASDRVTLRFANGGAGHVRLVIYDLTGRLINELIDEEMPAGDTAVEWLCQSDQGNPVAPGLYNVILDTTHGRRVERIAILPR